MTDARPDWSRAIETLFQSGDLVVVLQCGTAVEKKQIWVPVPIPKVGIQSFAFPIYRSVPYAARSATVVQDALQVGQTEMLADMDAMAVRNLKDRIPEMIIRTALRFAIKAYASYELNKNYGLAGAIAGSALTAITEQADLRGWLLMPSNLQIARIPMKEGQHNVTIVLRDANGHTLDTRDVTVKIERNKMTLVNLRGVQSIINDVQVSSSL